MRVNRLVFPVCSTLSAVLLVFACVHMPTYAPQNPAVKNEMHSGAYRDAIDDYREKLFTEGRQIFRHDTSIAEGANCVKPDERNPPADSLRSPAVASPSRDHSASTASARRRH